jgi:hypothetical protein
VTTFKTILTYVAVLAAGFLTSRLLDLLLPEPLKPYALLLIVAVALIYLAVSIRRARAQTQRVLGTSDISAHQRLMFQEPTKRVTYHDYELCVYKSLWRSEGWIVPGLLMKEQDKSSSLVRHYPYKRGTSVEAIEKDLKEKVNHQLGL